MKSTKNLRTITAWPCGQKIEMVRTMTDEEMENEGWERLHSFDINPICFVLTDGAIIYPSQDVEGNGPGEFFGKNKNGHFCLSLSEE